MPENKKAVQLHKPNIEPAKPTQVQIIEHGRDIHMFRITDTEIDELCADYMSIDFGLFTLCIGICIAFIISLVTADLSNKVFATFVAIVLASFLGIIFFGLRTLRSRKQLKERAKRIKESRKI
jgi:uncharacterized protein YacL